VANPTIKNFAFLNIMSNLSIKEFRTYF